MLVYTEMFSVSFWEFLCRLRHVLLGFGKGIWCRWFNEWECPIAEFCSQTWSCVVAGFSRAQAMCRFCANTFTLSCRCLGHQLGWLSGHSDTSDLVYEQCAVNHTMVSFQDECHCGGWSMSFTVRERSQELCLQASTFVATTMSVLCIKVWDGGDNSVILCSLHQVTEEKRQKLVTDSELFAAWQHLLQQPQRLAEYQNWKRFITYYLNILILLWIYIKASESLSRVLKVEVFLLII